MKKYVNILFLIVLVCNMVSAQTNDYYVQLEDASGVNISTAQVDLEAHAESLVLSITDSLLKTKFRVYDFGFYQHHEVTEGFPTLFETKRNEIALLTPYYILFGKQTDKNGVYTKIWVDLKMPTEGCFSGITTVTREIFEINFKNYVEVQFSNMENTPSRYVEVEKLGIDSLKRYFTQIADCCVNANKGVGDCSQCPENSEIFKWLKEKDFIGFKCDIDTIPNFENYNRVTNYSSSSMLNSNIFQNLSGIISSLPTSSTGAPKAYVTDNLNFCLTNNLFDSVNVKYSANLNDHDIWVHLWKGDNGEGYLFVKNEYYFLADDEDFFTDDIPVAKGSNSQEKATQSYWMTIDIPQNKLYVSNKPRPLMVTELGSPDPTQYEYFHIVKQGESFASIAEQSNGSFTASQLASWNNKTLQSVIHPEDKLFLFVNDIILSNLEDDLWCSSISIPRVNYNRFGLTYKPITTAKKLSDFAKNNPSLGFNNFQPNPRPVVYIAPPDETIYKEPKKPTIVNPESERPVEIPESDPISQSWISRNGWLVRGSLIAAFVLLPSNAFTVRTEGSPSSDLLDAQLKAEEEIKVELKNRIVPSPETSPQKGRRGLYVTYTKVQSNVLDHTNTPDGTDISMYTTKTYVGRTRGYNTAKNLVKIRNSNHHKNKFEVGYTKHGCVDMALYITALNPDNPAQRYADISYKFIRGREQNVMDDVGKPWVEMLNTDKRKTRSGNKINGISKLHPWFITWTQLARLYGLLPSVPFTFAPNCTP